MIWRGVRDGDRAASGKRPAEAKMYLDRVVGNGDSAEAHYLLGIQA